MGSEQVAVSHTFYFVLLATMRVVWLCLFGAALAGAGFLRDANKIRSGGLKLLDTLTKGKFEKFNRKTQNNDCHIVWEDHHKPHCTTEYENECSTEYSTACEEEYTQKCRNWEEEECLSSSETVCKTEYNKECTQTTEKRCTTEYSQQCSTSYEDQVHDPVRAAVHHRAPDCVRERWPEQEVEAKLDWLETGQSCRPGLCPAARFC